MTPNGVRTGLGVALDDRFVAGIGGFHFAQTFSVDDGATVPNEQHLPVAQAVAKAGKHVYTEKPIANTLEDAAAMIEACERAGVALLVGHLQRRFPANRTLKQLVASGAIGTPIMIEANNSSSQGFVLKPADFRWRDDDSGCPGACGSLAAS